jgi:uncharacterized protein (DUF2062 family)
MNIVKRKLKEFHERFLSLRGEPSAVALGMALGVFVGVTPTIPFHTVLIVAFGLLLRWNITSAYLGSWLISNPLTIPVFYYVQYEIGALCLGAGESALVLTDYSIVSLASAGWQILCPLLLGGVITAPFFAVPAYFITLRLVRSLRRGQA